MKSFLLPVGMLMAWAVSTPAALFTWESSPGTIIPDASQGVTFNGPTGLASGAISSVDVSLNISGGWNGDLYGYLVYTVGGNSTSIILLNRVGREGANDAGFSTSGMNVTLTGASGYSDIHTVSNPSDSTKYLADARTVPPGGDFTGATRSGDTAGLEYFNNSSVAADGSWMLFLSDRSPGDQSTLLSWSLNVEAVPEPTTWALLGFGLLFGGAGAWNWVSRSRTQMIRN